MNEQVSATHSLIVGVVVGGVGSAMLERGNEAAEEAAPSGNLPSAQRMGDTMKEAIK